MLKNPNDTLYYNDNVVNRYIRNLTPNNTKAGGYGSTYMNITYNPSKKCLIKYPPVVANGIDMTFGPTLVYRVIKIDTSQPVPMVVMYHLISHQIGLHLLN